LSEFLLQVEAAWIIHLIVIVTNTTFIDLNESNQVHNSS
jgi:hypothetical protein